MSEHVRRVGHNEALFREFNERVEDLHDEFEHDDRFEIVCECGDASCLERIAVTRDEYEALRSDPTQFAIKPGHDEPEAEAVVERADDRYVIVRKHEGVPAQVARRRDSRS